MNEEKHRDRPISIYFYACFQDTFLPKNGSRTSHTGVGVGVLFFGVLFPESSSL